MNFKTVAEVWEHLAQTVGCDIIASRPDKPFTEPEMLESGKIEAQGIIEEAKCLGVKFGRCLDFGCGIGRLTEWFADHFQETIGVDTSKTFLASAAKYGAGKATYIYSEDAETVDGEFDFIFSHLVFIHYTFEGIERELRRLAKKLSVDGIIRFDFFGTNDLDLVEEDEKRIQDNILNEHRSIVASVHLQAMMKLIDELNLQSVKIDMRNAIDREYYTFWYRKKS